MGCLICSHKRIWFHVYGGLSQTRRPHKDSDLKQVMVDDATLKIEHGLAISLDYDEIYRSRVYTTDCVKQELNLLNLKSVELEEE